MAARELELATGTRSPTTHDNRPLTSRSPSSWSDGEPAPEFDALNAVTLADTAAKQLRLTEALHKSSTRSFNPC